VNEESKKIISKSQKGEFMERLQHDVELRNDRKKERPVGDPEEWSFKPALNQSHKKTARGNASSALKGRQSAGKTTAAVIQSKPQNPRDELLHQRKQTTAAASSPSSPSPSSTHSFKPHLSTSSFNKKSHRPPSNPNIYIQQHEKMLEKRRMLQEKGLQQKAEMELEDCTFAPQIKECPKFVTNIARSISVVKSVRTTTAPPPCEGWK
jgi:hypothetical protein